ncbi:hypothetical protein B6V75_18290 [Thioclava sp. F1Mire-8]|nr:hypothetical protein B6V75_18290 [Thioclava sp. F1Mire-8]
MQLIAEGSLKAFRVLQSESALRSEKSASRKYLSNVAGFGAARVAKEQRAWYHEVAWHEFLMSAWAISKGFEGASNEDEVVFGQFRSLLEKNPEMRQFEKSSDFLREATGYSGGCWAFWLEQQLSPLYSTNAIAPSSAWIALEQGFNFERRDDALAIRLYPDFISKKALDQLITGEFELVESDAGWVLDSIRPHYLNGEIGIDEDELVAPEAVKKAIKVLSFGPEDKLSLYEWVQFLNNKTDEFDPRGGEWTSLEIVRQLVKIGVELQSELHGSLPIFYPSTAFVPISWKEQHSIESWEVWRDKAKSQVAVVHLEIDGGFRDYRFLTSNSRVDDFFRSTGRILWGLLSRDFDGPLAWNLRGNERSAGFPSVRGLETTPISSLTLRILNACLNIRSEENRLAQKEPSLFGLLLGGKLNDIDFDAPTLLDPEDLLEEIKMAQKQLENEQLSITYGYLRQLIPFSVKDFGAAKPNDFDGGPDVE